MTSSDELAAEWKSLLAGWAHTWGLPDLERRITIRVSSRLRTSLGRCVPARGEVRIASFLVDAPRSLLGEVLCHETAHAAVHLRHGGNRRPHGPEWRALMRAAGFEPRVQLPRDALATLPKHAQRARRLWEHRCPVCHAAQFAGRPVRQWRCAPCRAAGLDGELVISRTTGAAQR